MNNITLQSVPKPRQGTPISNNERVMSQGQVASQPARRNRGLGSFPKLLSRGVGLGWAHLLLSSPTTVEARNQRVGSISPQMLLVPLTHYHWWIIEDSPQPPLCTHTQKTRRRREANAGKGGHESNPVQSPVISDLCTVHQQLVLHLTGEI